MDDVTLTQDEFDTLFNGAMVAAATNPSIDIDGKPMYLADTWFDQMDALIIKYEDKIFDDLS